MAQAGGRPLPPEDAPTSVTRGTVVYLPIVSKPRPLVADRRLGPEVCLSWPPQSTLEQAASDFGFQFYYHSGSYAQERPEALPMLRAPEARPEYWSIVSYKLWQRNYSGLALLFNEPDMAEQDGPLSPEDAAALYRLAIRTHPRTTWITPNAISLKYLQRFLAAVGNDWRPQDRVGIHIYQTNGGYAVSRWPGEWIAEARQIVDESEAAGAALWVSEVGPSNDWPMADLMRYYEELLNAPGVEVVCVFTTSVGNQHWHASKRVFYDENGTLTPSGEAFTRTLK